MNDLLRSTTYIRTDLAYVAGLVLAILVTLHVLLRKREVASAVGWIGFAWFAPVSGSIAYYILGVNRVRRRARRLRQGRAGQDPASMRPPAIDPDLRPLERGIRCISERPVLNAAVQVFQNGDEAYPVMLEAIGEARHSVGLSSYIFHDDEWGGRFIDALAAAHARGAEVRVVIDGIGGGWVRSGAYHHLRRKGVPAARFLHSPLPWRMPFLNLRSHRKILLLDGLVGFTGGMNIGDENVLANKPKTPVQDTHFRLEGPVVAQLAAEFARDWTFASETSEELAGDAWFPDIPECTHGNPARVLDSGPDEDIEKIEFAMLQAVACAKHSIVIMTPYFLPDERLTTALSLAFMRGVSVDIIVPAKSDHTLVDWALRPNVKPLLSDGVRIWRCPPPFRHSKVMAVDGAWCLVGSCNWDIRSFRLNFELCVEFYDRPLASALAEFAQRCQGAALTLDEVRQRSTPAKVRDAAARLLLPYL